MKRRLCFVIFLLTLASSWAQGTVTFVVAGVSNSVTGALVPAGTSMSCALYWLPDQPLAPVSADFDGPQHVAAMTNQFTVPGGVNAGFVRIDGISPAGAPAWFQVRLWETEFGSSYEQAILTADPIGGRYPLAGTSSIARVDTGDPTTTPPGTAPNLALYLRYPPLLVIPEPAALALVSFGGCALLGRLRRKR